MNQPNWQFAPNARRAQPNRSQPGLNLGTPFGNFSRPAQVAVE
jgi:hypothetical protein